MKKIRKNTGMLCLLLAAALLLSGCGGSKTTETAVSATKVGTQKAKRGTLDITGTYIGTISPHNSVSVTPLVSGTVVSVNVKVGDRVKEGDVLCRFDDTTARLQLKSAQNSVESAKAGKEAAEDQIDAAQKQADASITSMEGQIRSLKEQKKSSEAQLEKLQENLDNLKKASEAAQETYETSRKTHDEANKLYIKYQSFLSANPDCATTAGLVEASIPKFKMREFDIPTGPNAGEGMTSDQETAEPEDDAEEAAAVKKQETALELLEALNDIPLSVEYLSAVGLETLKEDAEQAKTNSTTAASTYTQSLSSVSQLEASIKQIDAQIETLEDNIDAAEDAADSAGSTKAYDAQIKAAQTGVESAQYQVDLYTVTAPIDGIIEAVNVSENEISAQGYPAFTISDKDVMEVSFYVPEDVRDYLKPGDAVWIETSSGEAKARVSSIATAVDSQKGLFKIEAQVTSDAGKELLSNTSVTLSLVTNSVSDMILIPFDAVYYENDQAYVFLADQDRAVRRNITAGLYNNEMIAVMEGLAEGDEVITTWGAGLKDGAPIQVIEAD